jgi:YVTN family beta-propeller protein
MKRHNLILSCKKLTVALFLVLFGASVVFAQTRAYVPNVGDFTVSVIDSATNTVVATVPVGVLPIAVAVTPDGAFAYVTNNFDNTVVSVIKAATNTVVATIPGWTMSLSSHHA